MAKIFISYSTQDRALVAGFVTGLQTKGHAILMDQTVLKSGQIFKDVLKESQESADGTVVFITKNSVISTNVLREIVSARDFFDRKTENKFLIPVVFGDVDVPDEISDIYHLKADPENIGKTIDTLNSDILDFINQQRKGDTNSKFPIKLRDKGDTVKEIQTLLKKAGHYDSVVDGIFGQETLYFVTEFQKANNLKPTGEIDQETYQALATLAGKNSTETGGRSYWLLKINGSNWESGEFNKATEYYFNSYRGTDEKRPDYDTYHKLRNGDLILAYDYTKLSGIVCVFVLTAELYTDYTLGEIIKFQVSELLDPPVKLGENFPFFIRVTTNSQDKIFAITEDEFSQVLATATGGFPSANIYFNQSSISGITPDVFAGDIKDELGISDDVNALASAIAYKDLQPPLAIGLFGNWGSGKSFFMDKLQKKITALSREDNRYFCKNIIHVNFNSWHYSDANLWASIITKIFDALKKYGDKEPKKIEQLFKNLHSTQELIKDAELKKINIESRITALAAEQGKLEQQIKEDIETLKSLSDKDIFLAVLDDEQVKKDIETIKGELKQNIDLNSFQQIADNAEALHKGGQKIIKIFQMVYSIKKGNWWKVLLTAAVAFIITYFLANNIGFIKQLVGRFQALVLAVLTFISPALVFYQSKKDIINKVYERLVSLKKTCEQAATKIKDSTKLQRDGLQYKIQVAQNTKTDIIQALKELESKKAQIQLELDEIIAGKKVIKFIESRVSDIRYANSLGIISWIRKDFEELDFLLKQQFDAQKLAALDRANVEEIFEIDRIILYIDDLDRCDFAVVSRVLEAIHLLLAFPLFVVVVGVDPRWMHKAITKKYQNFLSHDPDQVLQQPGENAVNQMSATSYDYLEKIFQVPFVLKPMTQRGISNMIASQFGFKPEPEEKEGNAPPTGQQKEGEQPAEDTEKTAHPLPAEEKDGDEGNSQGERPQSAPNYEYLKLGVDEIEFMQSMGNLIGASPRTVKRYANIYRIIRTHANFRFTSEDKLEHYCIAMALLAITTGIPDISAALFKKAKNENENGSFKSFLEKFDKSPIHKQKLTQLSGLVLKKGSNKKVGDSRMKLVRINLELISRFSFRNLR